jgi:hypothetical protein
VKAEPAKKAPAKPAKKPAAKTEAKKAPAKPAAKKLSRRRSLRRNRCTSSNSGGCQSAVRLCGEQKSAAHAALFYCLSFSIREQARPLIAVLQVECDPAWEVLAREEDGPLNTNSGSTPNIPATLLPLIFP